MNINWQEIKSGNMRAIARAITFAENKPREFRNAIGDVDKLLNQSKVIGVTGPPAVGKSTFINVLIEHFRRQNKDVAVICIDPSSKRGGGSFLGDRIRMQEHAEDSKVFIRSLTTQGMPGGINSALKEIIDIFRIAKKDIIIVETAGAGQQDFQIRNYADCLILLLPPQGDSITFLKAGIIELADIIVLNQADATGAESIFQQLKDAINANSQPCFKISAFYKTGLNELFAALDQKTTLLSSQDKIKQSELVDDKKEMVDKKENFIKKLAHWILNLFKYLKGLTR